MGRAEELAQDAFVLALEQWQESDVPENPGGWLMATARHRAIDHVRREQVRQQKYALLAGELASSGTDPPAPDDDLLSLVFVACHPVLPRESRVALTLRLVGGLSTEEIARAFLVPSATLGQRVSRAKRTLREAGVPFEVPSASSCRRGCPRCSRSSTWCSTRATPRRPANAGCAGS